MAGLRRQVSPTSPALLLTQGSRQGPATASVLLLLLLLSCRGSTGKTIRVLSGSQDVASCGTEALPCGTLQHAIDLASDNDKVLALPGRHKAGGVNGIMIDKPITVYATGYAVVDCSSQGRGFYISAGATLKGLVVRNCTASNSQLPTHTSVLHQLWAPRQPYGGLAKAGGGILIIGTGANITLKGLVLEYCTATSGGGLAIWTSVTAPVAVNNVTIQFNEAGFGGGLAISGASSVTFTSCNIQSNKVQSDEASGRGGGVIVLWDYADADKIPKFISSNITANSGPGGGICLIQNATAHFLNCLITSNVAPAGNGAGALILLGGAAHFSATSFVNNTALQGAGGALYISGASTSATLSHCSVIANHALSGSGGGAYVVGAVLTVDSTHIQGNQASVSGAGIYTIHGEVLITCCAITLNHAPKGGGAFFDEYSAGSVINTSISNNTALTGAGVGVRGTEVLLIHCLISLNVASGGLNIGNGGGLIIGGSASATVLASLITQNQANQGAGMYTGNGAFVTVTGCAIELNQAGWHGAGVYIYGSIANFTHSSIIGNIAYDRGGGMIIGATSTVHVDACAIMGNIVHVSSSSTATGFTAGGGASVFGMARFINTEISKNTNNDGGGSAGFKAGGGLMISGQCSVIHCHISNNEASEGGGVFVYSAASAVFSTTIIKHNIGNEGGGVGIIGKSMASFDACFILGNSALTGQGGGVYAENGQCLCSPQHAYILTCLS